MNLRIDSVRIRRTLGALAALTFGCTTTTVHAQSILQIDPSIRSAALGGAANAVFWGGDPDAWANPALLGYDRGARYESARTQRISDSDPNGQFDTRRYRLGLSGVGVMLAGKPDRYGSTRLDHGITQITDTAGNVLSTTHPYEHAAGWGAGVSAGALTRSLMALAGSNAPALFRHLDLGAGFGRTDLTIHPDPAPVPAPDPTRTTDYGVFVRLTPHDTFGFASVPQAAPLPGHLKRIRDIRAHDPRAMMFPNVSPRRAPPAPVRFELAYGYSVQGSHPEALDGGTTVPLIARTRRHGLAALVSWGVPSDVGPAARAVYTPLVAVGVAADLEHVEFDGATERRDARHYGAEATFANVVSLRAGYVRDPAGDVHGTTYGLGTGLPLRDFGGVRFDWANVGRAHGQPRLSRHGFDLWVDPLAFWRALHGRGR